MKLVILLLALAAWVTACTPAATISPEPATLPPDTVATSPPTTEPETIVTSSPSYEPKPGDSNLERGTLSIGETTIILRESFPVQVVLGLGGDLPTPCHQLRVIVNPPDAENTILVEAYTVINPEMICVQVTKPFQEMIDLGSFPSGHYTVRVNGTPVGEFDS